MKSLLISCLFFFFFVGNQYGQVQIEANFKKIGLQLKGNIFGKNKTNKFEKSQPNLCLTFEDWNQNEKANNQQIVLTDFDFETMKVSIYFLGNTQANKEYQLPQNIKIKTTEITDLGQEAIILLKGNYSITEEILHFSCNNKNYKSSASSVINFELQ